MFASTSHFIGQVVPFLVLFHPAAATSCQVSTAPGTGELRLRGTVRFVEVEGGCWQFRADNGGRYELRSDQAPRSILRDGTRVTLVLEPRSDLASVCQLGTIADVEGLSRAQTP